MGSTINYEEECHALLELHGRFVRHTAEGHKLFAVGDATRLIKVNCHASRRNEPPHYWRNKRAEIIRALPKGAEISLASSREFKDSPAAVAELAAIDSISEGMVRAVSRLMLTPSAGTLQAKTEERKPMLHNTDLEDAKTEIMTRPSLPIPVAHVNPHADTPSAKPVPPFKAALARLAHQLVEAASSAEEAQTLSDEAVGAYAQEKRDAERWRLESQRLEKLVATRTAELAKFTQADYQRDLEKLRDQLKRSQDENDTLKLKLAESQASAKSWEDAVSSIMAAKGVKK